MTRPSSVPLHVTRKPPKYQQGLSLIEVLVAILIFVVGILGLIGLQTSVTLTQTETRSRSEAALLAQEMTGLLWTDMRKLNEYVINTDADCTAPACLQWLSKVRATLPNGGATLITASMTDAKGLTIGSNVDLTVLWQTPNGDHRRYQTTTAIIHGSTK